MEILTKFPMPKMLVAYIKLQSTFWLTGLCRALYSTVNEQLAIGLAPLRTKSICFITVLNYEGNLVSLHLK